jgi:hypothetical protein
MLGLGNELSSVVQLSFGLNQQILLVYHSLVE